MNETKIRQQLLQDFEQFARRMRLQYIFHGQNKEPHPFHVKSDWMPLVQPSVALESYLENIKSQLSEIKTTKPKNNLSRNEIKAVAELKNNTDKSKKGRQGYNNSHYEQIRQNKGGPSARLDIREHYKPLDKPMVNDTNQRVNEIITQLH